MYTILLITFFLIAILTVIFWQISTLISIAGGAQFVASDKEVFCQALKFANIKKSDILYELGSGYGENLILAYRKFDIEAVGVELSPFHYFISLIKLAQFPKIKLIRANLFQVNLANADIVYCYLLPKMLTKLYKKLKNELKQGSQLISYGFPIAEVKEYKKIKVARHAVYFYQF